MNIKDLVVAEELSHEERAAVRAGATAAAPSPLPMPYGNDAGSQPVSVVDAFVIEPGKALLGALGIL
jgi:hypothetical protein